MSRPLRTAAAWRGRIDLSGRRALLVIGGAGGAAREKGAPMDGMGGARHMAPRAVLEFALGGVGFSMDLDGVHRILPFLKFLPAPSGPQYLIGFINLHGRSVPLMDLSLRLGFERAVRCGLDTPVVVVSAGNGPCAFVVDDVFGIVEGPGGEIRVDRADGLGPFSAVAFTPSGMSLVLDLKAITDTGADADSLRADIEEIKRFLAGAARASCDGDGNGDAHGE